MIKPQQWWILKCTINVNNVFCLFVCFYMNRSTVRVVASNASGMGKSLYVKRLAQKLQKQCQIKSQHIIVPIHGPVVNADTVMASLNSCTANQALTAQIIHFDIASSVSNLMCCQLCTCGSDLLHVFCMQHKSLLFDNHLFCSYYF